MKKAISYMKLTAKKYLNKIHIILILMSIVFAVLISGCNTDFLKSKKTAPLYDKGTYSLSGLSLSGEPADVASVFPEGGWLLLSNDGTGSLILGQSACDIIWEENSSGIYFDIAKSKANGVYSDGGIAVTLDTSGFEFIFTAENYSPEIAESKAEELSGPLGGNWSGSFWFSEGIGEYEDYNGREYPLHGNISKETVTLYCDYYSDLVPMISINYEKDGETYKCLSGYIMSYPLYEWSAIIESGSGIKSDLKNSVIINYPGDYGHKKVENNESEEDVTLRDILRITGSCRDGNGGFNYLIELTPS